MQGAGTITLAVLVPQPDQIRLTLADDGVGLPSERTRSSGLQSIAMLAESKWGRSRNGQPAREPVCG
ncbi:hypothetical protein [Azospirillum sp. sgz302134]